MRDKDIPGLLAKIAPLVDVWHCCTLPTARAATAPELASLVQAATGRPGQVVQVHTHESPATALRAAAAGADPADRIVVFGSFYTVGGVLKEGLPRPTAAHVA
jgi:dihydrofolate synthase/folylpolyglutamate synthase